jgi:hypothetical protein
MLLRQRVAKEVKRRRQATNPKEGHEKHHLFGGAEQEPVKSAMLLETRWRRHK